MQTGTTDTADDNETQLSEESDTDETQATNAPQTPPRKLRQAATHILNLLQWEGATDGIVLKQRIGPAILYHNHYSSLQVEPLEHNSNKEIVNYDPNCSNSAKDYSNNTWHQPRC